MPDDWRKVVYAPCPGCGSLEVKVKTTNQPDLLVTYCAKCDFHTRDWPKFTPAPDTGNLSLFKGNNMFGKFKYGLRYADKEPQVYRLSHILASYQAGVPKDAKTITVGAEDETVKSDGSIDFRVPERFENFVTRSWFHRMGRRFRIALEVLLGHCDILYYR